MNARHRNPQASDLERENGRLRRELAEREQQIRQQADQIAEQQKQIADAEKQIADLERQLALRSNEQGPRQYRGRLGKPKQIAIKPASNATINRGLALLKHAFYMGWKAHRARSRVCRTSPCSRSGTSARASLSMISFWRCGLLYRSTSGRC
jgi:hypothetical protein